MANIKGGCILMSEDTNLNPDRTKPNWPHILNVFVNACGKFSKTDMEFRYMDNNLVQLLLTNDNKDK